MRLPVFFHVPPVVTALVAAAALTATAVALPAADSPLLTATQATTSAFVDMKVPTGAPNPAVTARAPNPAVTAQKAGSPAGNSSRGDLAFAWPLSLRPTVLRRFDQPRDQWSPGHRGVDLVAAVGEQVLSASGGVVAFSGMIAGRGVITIRHPGGLRTTYEPVDDRLKSGTLVHTGSRIGLISPTAGHCAPITCLHWGAISGHAYRDPLSLLRLGRPILLPLG